MSPKLTLFRHSVNGFHFQTLLQEKGNRHPKAASSSSRRSLLFQTDEPFTAGTFQRRSARIGNPCYFTDPECYTVLSKFNPNNL